MRVSRRTTLSALAFCCLAAYTQGASSQAQEALERLPQDAQIARALAGISASQVQVDIATLVSFGTRSTLSSMETDLPAGHGINAAADWVESEFKKISADCGGCLEVKRDVFHEEPAAAGKPRNRFARSTRLTNVYAILHGSAPAGASAPWVLVTGHMDSRVNDVMDAHAAAPGANDDASGVAVSLESARALAGACKTGFKPAGTIVFVAVAGEEQGLNGSAHLAKLAKAEAWPLEAVLNNDIVGGDTTPGQEAVEDKTAVHVFSEGVPLSAAPEVQRQMLMLGAENDSPSRQLARTVAELAPVYFSPGQQHAAPAAAGMARSHAVRLLPAFHPVLVLRRDRYLRGGDHTSFNAEGFAAIRFTEWRENFNHQHQALRTENGVQYGDLLKFVDLDYVANVARINTATLATLASAPGVPRNVKILTAALDNSSELTWEAPAFAPVGTVYEVVWRATNELLWTSARSVGTATSVKLDVSKDNVLFGVRAVDSAGHRSLAVPPVPGR